MALLLKERDYVADGSGGVAPAEGETELLGEALFRLTARRGSFPFLPRLGSRLYRLSGEKSSAWQSLARQYAAEALADLDGVTVTDAAAVREDDSLAVRVSLLWQGSDLEVTARLEGMT